MQDKDKELSKYRFSLAKETLANAKMCLDNHFFRDCINRSYYVATSIFPKELGKRLGRIKMVREESDYSDFFVASLEEARKQYETAGYIVNFVETYLKNQKVLE